MTAAIVSAKEKPAESAEPAEAPPWRSATVTRAATPIAPPSCCTELNNAEPRPAFSALVPVTAAAVRTGRLSPHPHLVRTRRVGITVFYVTRRPALGQGTTPTRCASRPRSPVVRSR